MLESKKRRHRGHQMSRRKKDGKKSQLKAIKDQKSFIGGGEICEYSKKELGQKRKTISGIMGGPENLGGGKNLGGVRKVH